MLNKLIGIAIVSFVCAISITELSAQSKKEQKKIVIVEKTIDDNGNVTETKKVLEGDAADKYLEDNKAEAELSKIDAKKMFRIKVVDDEGNEKLLEWDGEGEMPAEMKELLDEEDLGHLTEDHKTQKKRVKVLTKKGDEESVQEFDFEGDDLPEDVKKMLKEKGVDPDEITKTIKMENTDGKKVMMIKKEGAGLEEVMDFDWEGDELPEEVRKVLEQEGIELEEIIDKNGERQIKVTAKGEEKPTLKGGKAQLGVLIEKDILGALIAQVVPKSAAEDAGLKVGDIITNVNDAKIIATTDLIMSIADYKPDDKITVKYIRDGQAQLTTVTLKERIDPFPFKTWESVMKNGEKEIEIEIEKK